MKNESNIEDSGILLVLQVIHYQWEAEVSQLSWLVSIQEPSS